MRQERRCFSPTPPGSLPSRAWCRRGTSCSSPASSGFREGSSELVPGGVGPETQAALEAIAANLAKAGLGMQDVVKCSVFLADIADFQAMNDAYGKFFPRDPPVRTTAGVSGLWGKARVEIECMAMTR